VRILRFIALALSVLPAFAASAKTKYEKRELSVPGQILWLDWGDFDADGLVDLVVSYSRGQGPDAQRFLGVFFRRPDGLPREPDLKIAAPQTAAMFDVGDALAFPGDELVFMGRFGVFAQSLAGRKPGQLVAIIKTRTIAVTPEEEDLVRWDFLRTPGPGEAPLMLVPTGGPIEIYKMDANGIWIHTSRIDVDSFAFFDAEAITFKRGRRGGAGPRPYSIVVTTVVPALTFLDQDGDGRRDLITTYRDRVAVHFQKTDGTLTSTPGYSRWLKFLTTEEQASGDMDVYVEAIDINGDGIADLSANKLGGGITNLRTETRIYLGQKGGGFSPSPTQVWNDSGFATLVNYADLDGDGTLEMVHPLVGVSIMSMSSMLISSKMELDLRVRRRSDKAVFGSEVQTLDLVFGLDFSTGGALRGAPPLYGKDFDGDGVFDAVLTTASDELQIFRGLGKKSGPIFDDDATITLSGIVSRETYALPQSTKAGGLHDILAAYVDVPKMAGKLLCFAAKRD